MKILGWNDICSLRWKVLITSNSMKLGHIIKYHDDVFKFQNGP